MGYCNILLFYVLICEHSALAVSWYSFLTLVSKRAVSAVHNAPQKNFWLDTNHYSQCRSRCCKTLSILLRQLKSWRERKAENIKIKEEGCFVLWSSYISVQNHSVQELRCNPRDGQVIRHTHVCTSHITQQINTWKAKLALRGMQLRWIPTLLQPWRIPAIKGRSFDVSTCWRFFQEKKKNVTAITKRERAKQQHMSASLPKEARSQLGKNRCVGAYECVYYCG